MSKSVLVLLLPFIVLPAPAALADETGVGFVKTLSGTATVFRGGSGQAAAMGAPVFEKDRIETGADGEIGITFRDDTRVSLGPGTRFEIEQFSFQPATRGYGFSVRLLVGTMQYLSGLIGKLAPQTIRVETPTATIGVRGTHFLARAGG